MRNIFIPSDIFDGLTTDLARRLSNGLNPDIATGQIEPHQIAAIFADNCVLPVDVVHQIVNDANADAARQAESMVPAIARPAA
ncbi:hypothetical protein [Neorhizobium alkalisoli]|uniref:hypothetical protein n=1 Tax=Neorhizobium alkalisoli TaxID=528178 RepID=UPI000CF8C40E|nr:hypothetical protein [Neorhizobium alkalisoli]